MKGEDKRNIIVVSTPKDKSGWYKQIMDANTGQTDTWYTKDYRPMTLDIMSVSHIEKCIAMIQKSETGWRIEFLVPLRKELARRNSELGEIIYGD